MRKIIRLSHIISQFTPSYGDRDGIFIRDNSSILKGETANSSCWIFSNNHIGTHIDSPRHFSATGTKTQDFPLEEFYFDIPFMLEMPYQKGELIDIKAFQKMEHFVPYEVDILLIRTGYESYRDEDKYWNDNPGLAAELADYLREKFPKLRCVGFDFISLTSWNFRLEGRASHKAFLCPSMPFKPILVIEDMALKQINSDLKEVIVAPLFVEDGNGGAVTVFANIN